MQTNLVIRNPGAARDLIIPLTIPINTDKDKILENVLKNSRKIKKWVKTAPAHDRVAVVCGGGPSLNDTLDELKAIEGDVFALNGTAEFLGRNGVSADYQILMDARPETATLIGPAKSHLFASQVDPACFDACPDAILWHATLGDVLVDEQEGFAAYLVKHGIYKPEERVDLDDGYCLIGSSISVGNTSLVLLYAMGYRTIHCFGFDCSQRDGKGHAYLQPLNDGEPCTIRRFGGKSYICSVSMAYSADHFMGRAAELERGGCRIEVHGSGYLPDMWSASRPYEVQEWQPVTVCCLQTENYLGRGAEYVNVLFDMVRRNVPEGFPFRFVCFTDDPTWLDERIVARELPEQGMTGWWNKLALFKRGVFEPDERVWFFDLDTLITGPLDKLFSYRGSFALLEDFYRGKGALQSSVMTWTGDECAEIWEDWDAKGRPQFWKTDQEFIEEFGSRPVLQDLFPASFISYKTSGRIPPRLASVVVFHGEPRPHEVDGWAEGVWKIGGIGRREILDLTLSEAEKYEITWRMKSYREFSPGEEAVSDFIGLVNPKGKVLDIGCGTGRASLEMAKRGLEPILIDFTSNSRDPEALRLPFIQADITQPLPVSSRYGFSCDVLEHILPHDVEAAVRSIMEAVEIAFLQISTVPDNSGPALFGTHLHATIKPHEWWSKLFESLLYRVEYQQDFGAASRFVVTRGN